MYAVKVRKGCTERKKERKKDRCSGWRFSQQWNRRRPFMMRVVSERLDSTRRVWAAAAGRP